MKSANNGELVQFVRGKGRLVSVTVDEKGRTTSVREKGNLRGVIVAKVIDNEIRFGWSYAIKKGGVVDIFDKDRGLTIARNRLTAASSATVPRQIQKEIEKNLSPRALKYFKVVV